MCELKLYNYLKLVNFHIANGLKENTNQLANVYDGTCDVMKQYVVCVCLCVCLCVCVCVYVCLCIYLCVCPKASNN